MDLCADHDTLLREKQLLNASLEPTSGLHARTSRSPPWQTALFHPLYCIATSERERVNQGSLSRQIQLMAVSHLAVGLSVGQLHRPTSRGELRTTLVHVTPFSPVYFVWISFDDPHASVVELFQLARSTLIGSTLSHMQLQCSIDHLVGIYLEASSGPRQSVHTVCVCKANL